MLTAAVDDADDDDDDDDDDVVVDKVDDDINDDCDECDRRSSSAAFNPTARLTASVSGVMRREGCRVEVMIESMSERRGLPACTTRE